jgi:hypothetical protein
MKIAIPSHMLAFAGGSRYLCHMVPDYPRKTFGDKRRDYCLLMEVMAMGN